MPELSFVIYLLATLFFCFSSYVFGWFSGYDRAVEDRKTAED